MTDHKTPWVLCRLHGQLYGIPASHTQEMVTIPKVTNIPRSPEYVRGVINLRGTVMALLDLRLKLNMPTLGDERDQLVENLRMRKQEHANWVDALEKTVEEGEPFTLARDPSKCLFGKWYDTFKTGNHALNSVLIRFNAPHKAIHASADKVAILLEANQKDQAKDLIHNLRATHQKEIFKAFDDMENMLLNAVQEIAVVVEHQNNMLALTVDSIESVEELKENSLENLPDNMSKNNGYVVGMLGRRVNTDEPVLIPDLGCLISSAMRLTQTDQPLESEEDNKAQVS